MFVDISWSSQDILKKYLKAKNTEKKLNMLNKSGKPLPSSFVSRLSAEKNLRLLVPFGFFLIVQKTS